jgi:hypothetical protein
MAEVKILFGVTRASVVIQENKYRSKLPWPLLKCAIPFSRKARGTRDKRGKLKSSQVTPKCAVLKSFRKRVKEAKTPRQIEFPQIFIFPSAQESKMFEIIKSMRFQNKCGSQGTIDNQDRYKFIARSVITSHKK